MRIEICSDTKEAIVYAVFFVCATALIVFGAYIIKDYNLKSLKMYTDNGYSVQTIKGIDHGVWTKGGEE